jgi:hypothetical protein
MSDGMSDKMNEIRAFTHYITQQCVAHHFSIREATIVAATLVEEIVSNQSDAELERYLIEFNNLIRDLRKALTKNEELPN